MFGLVHQGGQFRHLGPDLVGQCAPPGAGGRGSLLREGGGDEGGDDAPALAGMGKGIALEVYATALPVRAGP